MLSLDTLKDQTLTFRATFARNAVALAAKADTIPPGWKNNVRWHVGHMVVTPRLLTNGLLGRPLGVPDAYRTWFAKGTSPADWGTDPVPALEQLAGEVTSTVDQLFAEVGGDADTAFAQPYTTTPGVVLRTPAESLVFSQTHDGIHMGLMLALKRALEAMPPHVHEAPVQPMKGPAESLGKFRGDALLVVNVASKCGFTPQYAGLEALHREFAPKGLRVLGFPCNDFGGQEPGTDDEVAAFCSANFGVTFPVYSKVSVLGPGKCPLYRSLTEAPSPFPGDVRWNFEKFLVGRDGRILARFGSKVAPDATELLDAIGAALA